MAAITVYPTEVRPLDAHLCIMVPLIAASAVTCGDAVYLDTAGKIAKADADALASSQAIGVVVGVGNQGYTIAAAGDMCDVVLSGPVFLGESVALTIGSDSRLYVSTTAGAMDQTLNVTAGDYPFQVGFPFTAQSVWVRPQVLIPTVNP